MKIVITLLSMLLFHFSTGMSQDNKKYAEVMKEADEYIQSNDFKEALPLLLSLKNSDNNSFNVAYKLGICYLHSHANLDLSISNFTRAIGGINNSYNESDELERNSSPLTYLYLGDAYRLKNQLSEAIHAYDNYVVLLKRDDISGKITVQKRINECRMARAIMRKPVDAKFSNAGAINTLGSSNYAGCISGDGNTMVFVRSLKFYEAVFITKRDGNEWSEPLEITSRLGSDGDFIPTGLNYDGTCMLLTSFSILSSNDIYESKLVKDKWEKAKQLKFQVSSKYNDIDAVYSSDGKYIYFSSNRENGYGGYDIYKSSKDDNGNWSFVENLGKGVNTAFDERSPGLMDDNHVLIYSSNGGNGMGGFDLYYTRLNSSGHFVTSYNVGFPINSTDDDLGFKPFNKPGDALISRFDPHSSGESDLVFVHFTEFSNFRKIPLQGQLTINGDHSWAQPVQLYFVDKISGDTVQKADILSGTYETSLYPGDFILNTSRKFSQPFTISSDTSIHLVQLTTVITDTPGIDKQSGNTASVIDSAKTAVLANRLPMDTLYVKDILFGFNDYAISELEIKKLSDILVKLNHYKGITIMLSGYTDAMGATAYNKKLAGLRATSVRRYFISNGIPQTKISVEAYGNINFVASNTNPDGTDNPTGRALNRRVEMKISIKSPAVFIIHDNPLAGKN